MKSALTENKKSKHGFLLVVLFLAVCLFFGKLFFSEKKPFFVFGYSFFVITSPSMEPSYPVDSLIIVKKEAFSSLEAGEIIVFRSTALSGGLAFHRITQTLENGVYTKGDNNSREDSQLITESDYVGKGVLYSYHLGRYITATRSLKGFVVFFVLPVFAIYSVCFCFKRLIEIWKLS